MTLKDKEKNENTAGCSIIVPTFNSEKTIDACLQALFGQSIQHHNCEIIVVDDGSNDRTLQIVERYPVKVIKNQIKTGAYAARNLGIKQASGNILVFTDATCFARSGWLSNLLLGFKDAQVGCVGGQILSAPPHTIIQHFCADRKTHDMQKFLDREIPFFAGGNVAIRREVFKRIGLFDQSLQSGGDGDFSFRVKLDGKYRIAFQPDACVYYNYRETLCALLGQAYKYGRGIARFRLKHYGRLKMSRPVKVWPNVVALIRQVIGILVIPVRAGRDLRRIDKFTKALVFQFIDKLHSIWFHAGIVIGLIKFRGQKRSNIQPLIS